MRRRAILLGVVIIVVVIAFFAFKGKRGGETTDIIVPVNIGSFEVDVTTTGELEALNSVKIMGPTGLRNYRIWNVTIQDIIDEGTMVRKGDWIATLDKSDLTNKIKDAEAEVETKESQFIQTKLDTTLQMRQARDELINLQYNVEEKEIVLQQSQFEPPATIKQAEIELEKAKRALQQAKDSYSIKLEQNKAKMQEVAAGYRKSQRELNGLLDLERTFTVIAPEDGMLIYRKGWDGKAMKQGSQISGWDPVVAELPDMTTMLSKTFVNEVDVRKIKSGMMVEIGFDAFPEKSTTGRVIKVANVGEQRPNSDAKVFQVDIRVNGSDDDLRPSMTTSNRIIAQVMDSTMYVPLEALHNEFDSVNYVFKKDGLGIIKQEIEVGETNSDAAIVLAGLNPEDRVYLSTPRGMEDKTIAMIPEMDGKRWQPQKEIEEVEMPAERTITLPDGRVITVPADGRGRGGERRGNRQRNNDTQQSKDNTSQKSKSTEKETQSQ